MKIRPEVDQLLQAVHLAEWRNEILGIACQLSTDCEAAYTRLVALDEQIPGLGQHNVNEYHANFITGTYRIEDRPIFRGIQYVGQHISFYSPEWIARTIVAESCYHVESCLKRRLRVTGHLSLGMILQRGNSSVLDPNLVSVLKYMNKLIYNNAKHTIEDLYMDEHMFSPADAIAVYLSCRVLGAILLKDSGITNNYGELVF